MKNIFFILLLINTLFINAQESIPTLKETPVKLAELDRTAIYPGCSGDNNNELNTCLSAKMRKLVSLNFNISMVNTIGLSEGRKKIDIFFIIDEKGFVTNVEVKAPHPKLKEEAIRITKLIPKLEPGKLRGKTVKVSYSLPIVFVVLEQEEVIETKKMRKMRLKRERKQKKELRKQNKK